MRVGKEDAGVKRFNLADDILGQKKTTTVFDQSIVRFQNPSLLVVVVV